MNNHYDIAVLVSNQSHWEHWRDDFFRNNHHDINRDKSLRNKIVAGEFIYKPVKTETDVIGIAYSGIIIGERANLNNKYDEILHMLYTSLMRK